MYAYQKIHFWELPPTKIGLALNKDTKDWFLDKSIQVAGSQQKVTELLNSASENYGKRIKYGHGMIRTWKYCHNRHLPVWVVLELTKLICPNAPERLVLLTQIERGIEYYRAGWGGTYCIKNPKLPIIVTPELVSVVFHFCGDGHLSFRKHTTNSYRQINLIGLKRVYDKLQNCFGEFALCENAFKNGKLEMPRVIGEIYKDIFKLGSCRWDEARIPEPIKNLPKEFLLAGLVAFIVDEGSIGEVIQIYSKNPKLLADIREVAQKIDYKCLPIREKYARGVLDCYRFSISPQSYLKMCEDLDALIACFPTCDFAHKTDLFKLQVERVKRGGGKRAHGLGFNQIINILERKLMTTDELIAEIKIGKSSLRELLTKLESKGIVKRAGWQKRKLMWKLASNTPKSFSVAQDCAKGCFSQVNTSS